MIRQGMIATAGIAVILAFAVPPVRCEEVKPSKYWYRLEIQTGDTTYQCMGSSALSEKEFARQLSGDEFVMLDDIAYPDASGKIKGWQEWDTRSTPRLYVNPEYVIFFNPLKEDPKKAGAAGRK